MDPDVPPSGGPTGAGDADPSPAGLPPYALRSAFEEAPTGMAVLTLAGVVRAANAALGELLQRAAADLAGRTLLELTLPDDLPAAREEDARLRSAPGRVVRSERRLVRADGTSVWVLVSTSRPAEVPGREGLLVVHVQDIADRKALEAELVRQALHDPLTGLPNRALLLDRAEHALARSRREPGRTCLFYLDLNGFKAVNDTYGHAAGDDLLRQLAARVTALLRPGDTAARLGGDEFAVLCEDTDPDRASGVADRLRAAAAAPFVLASHASLPGGPHTVRLGAAVGMAADGDARPGAARPDAEALLRLADQQMYAAKRGRAGEPPVG